MLLSYSNGEVKGVTSNSSKAARKRTDSGTVTAVGRPPLARESSPLEMQHSSGALSLWDGMLCLSLSSPSLQVVILLSLLIPARYTF